MASNYYDKNKDYSAAIEAAKASGASQATIKQLETERQNKINAVYGGNEPTMYGSDKTYNQLSGGNASSTNQAVIRDAVNTANSAANSTVQQQMEQAAQNNNWDLVGSLANQLATPDGYYGGYNMEYANSVLNDLQNKYGYNANNYYQGLYDAVYGEGAWDGGTGTGKPVYNDYSNALVQLYNSTQGSAPTTQDPLAGLDQNALSSLLTQFVGGGNPSGSYSGGSSAPEWGGSRWDSVLDSIAEKLLNMDYDDWTQGDQYAALADRYGRQGQMSMRDVLGQMASRTGGLASSYATTAANQQYNNWMADLESAAREMYGLEQDDLMDKAQLARQYSMDDYNQFLDMLSQYNTDRNFNYNVWQDQQKQMADRAEMMASVGDFSGFKALGYTDDQIALLQAATQMEQAQATPKKGGGGYNNGGVDKADIMRMQEELGVTPDGLWGSESKKAAKEAGWSTDPDEAWASFGGGSPVVPDKTGGNYDYWTGNGSTSGGKTSLNWDQDEGVFTWNGQNYYTLAELADAIDAANLTDTEKQTLTRKFGLFGFDIEIT